MSWKGDYSVLSETLYLGIDLNRTHACDKRLAKMAAPVMSTVSHSDSLTPTTDGSNEMLHNIWNVRPFMLQSCKMLWKCLGLGGGFLWSTCWTSAFHRCSIGFKSIEWADQGNIWTWWCCRNSWLTCATFGLALSCWNIPSSTFTCGMTWCCWISSRYTCWCSCHMLKSRPTIMMGLLPTPCYCHHRNTVFFRIECIACKLRKEGNVLFNDALN